MPVVWQQISPLEGFSVFTFERGPFIAASKWNEGFHTWTIFRRLDDGSLKPFGGVWSSQSSSATSTDFRTALSWADQQIAMQEQN